MSQTKVQLIAPIGVVTASTLETTGVLTATTFVGDIAGTVTGITSTTDNLDVGILTATAFVGDFTGTASSIVTGSNVTAGIITGTKFVGNATGTVSGLADDTNINVGILTSTSFVGDLTGNAAGLSTTNANLSLGIVTATSFAGNITGNAAGISVTTTNANLGIITASAFHGSGANLEGVSSGPVAQQAVTANGATTTIDLSSGNLIYMTQSANTTVAFANTEGNTDTVYLIREKDATSTARTITWPSGMVWDGGTEPTLLNVNDTNEGQIFKLTTRDNGATWYGAQVYNNDSGGLLFLWGRNDKGNLGQNTGGNSIYISSPTQILGGGTWKNVYSNMYDQSNPVIGRKADGTVWGWGASNRGSMIYNTGGPALRSSPVQLPGTDWSSNLGITPVKFIGAKTDGTLWVSGSGEYGETGQNNRTYYSSPVQIPGTTWSTSAGRAVADTSVKSCLAIKTDGTLWAWGSNTIGNLGLNDKADRSSPVQIPGTTWRTISGGFGTNMATKTDGTLWIWGRQNYGSLGINATGARSSPTQIPGTTWNRVAQGKYVSMATKTDGTLWTWGDNEDQDFGQLGLNDNVSRSSPTQVPGTDWIQPLGTVNGRSAGAVRTDGTLWTWGTNAGNQAGVLGLNQATGNYSSPVQVPGTWKTGIRECASSSYGMYAIKQ